MACSVVYQWLDLCEPLLLLSHHSTVFLWSKCDASEALAQQKFCPKPKDGSSRPSPKSTHETKLATSLVLTPNKLNFIPPLRLPIHTAFEASKQHCKGEKAAVHSMPALCSNATDGHNDHVGREHFSVASPSLLSMHSVRLGCFNNSSGTVVGSAHIAGLLRHRTFTCCTERCLHCTPIVSSFFHLSATVA